MKTRMGKRGVLPIILILALMLAGVGAVLGIGKIVEWVSDGDGTDDALTIEKDGKTQVVEDPEGELTEKSLTSCDGIASVNALYNDINAYKAGTDPSNITTIYEKNGEEYVKTVTDDATSTTVPVLSEFEALAGNNLGTVLASYFSEEISFKTMCSDVDIQPNLYPASAPTLTVVNDDAITKNSDSNHEDMAASTKYLPCVTVKAPSEACSARYGAVVAFEYDATYNNLIDSSNLDSSLSGVDSKFLVAHSDNLTADMAYDQYVVKFWNEAVMDIDGDGVKDKGALCDGQKVEFCFDVTTTATSPAEDTNNIVVHWYPINKDLDADELTLIKGIYDEDNNVIAQGNTTAILYTA